jgi:hypothetical protein
MTAEELNRKIDASIATLEEALKQKRDRRQDDQPHEQEKRDGFDRRARPAKE